MATLDRNGEFPEDIREYHTRLGCFDTPAPERSEYSSFRLLTFLTLLATAARVNVVLCNGQTTSDRRIWRSLPPIPKSRPSNTFTVLCERPTEMTAVRICCGSTPRVPAHDLKPGDDLARQRETVNHLSYSGRVLFSSLPAMSQR